MTKPKNDPSPEKVFCKNCVFLHRNIFDSTILTCVPELDGEASYDPIEGKYIEYSSPPERHPRDRNANFDCKYYHEARWYNWRFWVK